MEYKNKDPAVLFFTSDFLSSTFLWSYEDVGKYIRLLCLQHQQKGLTESDLDAICQGSDRVREKFQRGDDGKFYNLRMQMEIERRENYLMSQSEKGKKSAAARKLTAVEATVNTAVVTAVATQLQPGGNENINENKDIDIDNKKIGSGEEEKKEKEERKSQTDIYIDRFERFWKGYPKKVGKGDARKIWTRLRPSEELTLRMINAVEIAKKSVEWTKDGGQYIPNPSTWLNQSRWEDELTPMKEEPSSAQEPKSETDRWFEEVYMEGRPFG